MIQIQELRANLRREGQVWVGHCHLKNRSDVEIEVSGDDVGPFEDHLNYAAECVSRLTQLLPALEGALNAVREDHPLFPPSQSSRWYLEGLSFVEAESHRGKALFTLDEQEYDYLYVLYSVEIVEGRIGEAHAVTR